jgi:Fe-S-cluster containining protein
MRVGRPPYDAGELAGLPEALRGEMEMFAESPRMHWMSGVDAPCYWLDLVTGRCRHYEHRPEACRDFKVGSRACQILRMGAGLTVKGMPVVKD